MGIISAEYIAGFIDGEGSITISEHRRLSRDTPNGHQVALSIANTNLDVLNDIALWMRNLGAKVLIRPIPPGKEVFRRRSACYQLITYGNSLKLVLPYLEQFIRIKYDQVQLAYEFLDTMPGNNRPVGTAIRELRSEMAMKMSWLNHGCP